jgi:hypothetical protein
MTSCRQMLGLGAGDHGCKSPDHPLGEVGRQSAGHQQRRHADRSRRHRYISFAENRPEFISKFFRMPYHTHECFRRKLLRGPGSAPEYVEFFDGL